MNNLTGIRLAASFCTGRVTLHWRDGGLCEANVAFCDVVRRLMLGDLYARAHVALAVEEEGEGARQALAGGQKTEKGEISQKKGRKGGVVQPLFVSACCLVPFNHMEH